MSRRPLVDAAAEANVTDETCPIERARLIGVLARQFGTLPRRLFEIRRAALVEARKDHSAADIAEALGLHPSRISQIVGPSRNEAAA